MKRIVFFCLVVVLCAVLCTCNGLANEEKLPVLIDNQELLYAAKIYSTWEGCIFYCLQENGYLYVYPASASCDLDQLYANAEELEPIYATHLTDSEMDTIQNAIDDIDKSNSLFVQLFDDPYIAIDSIRVTTYIDGTESSFSYGAGKNENQNHVLELILSYSTGTFVFDDSDSC